MISPQKNRKFRKVKILDLCPLSHTCNLISAKMQKVRSVQRLGKNISAVLMNPTIISETKLAAFKEGGNDIRRDVTMTGNPWLKWHCYLWRCGCFLKVLPCCCKLHFLSPVLTFDIHNAGTHQWHPTVTRHSKTLWWIPKSTLSPKTGCKGMTQHPAAAGILYRQSRSPIGGEGKPPIGQLVRKLLLLGWVGS